MAGEEWVAFKETHNKPQLKTKSSFPLTVLLLDDVCAADGAGAGVLEVRVHAVDVEDAQARQAADDLFGLEVLLADDADRGRQLAENLRLEHLRAAEVLELLFAEALKRIKRG